MACRSGGTISVAGVYGGLVDKFPAGTLMNRSLSIRTGQTHVQRYLRPLLERIENGDIDPSFVITHRMKLDEAPEAYRMFRDIDVALELLGAAPKALQLAGDEVGVLEGGAVDFLRDALCRIPLPCDKPSGDG